MTTKLWWWFWTLSFIFGAGSFALIAVVVLFRGLGDLRQMVRAITARHRSEGDAEQFLK